MDILSKCIESEYRWRNPIDAGLYAYYRSISSAQDPVVTYQGNELVMLGSNNYLGLASNPEVKEAATMAVAMYGSGSAGSRLLNGTPIAQTQQIRR